MTSLLLLAMGCNEPTTGGYDLNEDEEEARGTPRIEVLSPLEGEGFYGGAGTLTFALTDWKLAPGALGEEDADGEGHVHLYVDEVLSAEVTSTEVPLSGLSSGPHKLRVALATNDHGEFGEDSTIDIGVASPRVRFTNPVEASLLARSSVDVALDVQDFVFEAPEPGAAAGFARGYVQLSVDGEPWDWTTDPAATTITRLLPGTHTLSAELRTRDGLPLPTPAKDSVNITVEDGAVGVAIDASGFPRDGSPWDSGAAPLAITTSNYTLGGGNFYHLYVDGDFYRSDTRAETSITNLAPGDHVLEVRLTSGGSETGTFDRLRLRVTPDRPDIRVTYPGARWNVRPDFTLNLAVENFELQPKGSGGGSDRGYYQVSMDGAPLVSGSSEAIAMNRLPLGLHTFRVELLQDDGTPLAPPAFTEVDFTVTAPSTE